MLITISNNSENSITIDKDKFDYSHTSAEYKWYIKGRLFYLLDSSGRCVPSSEIDDAYLSNFMAANGFDAGSIKDRLEGHYICVVIQGKRITIFGDKFNRLNLFFTGDKSGFYFDTALSKALINKGGRETSQQYLYSYFLIGYAHSSLTLFENIKRLAHDEVLVYDGTLAIRNVFTPTLIENIEAQEADVFADLFRESIRYRMGKGANFISTSSGWDSTLILDTLLALKDKKDIKSGIIKVKTPDQRVLNIYEIDKVQRIARHYGIESHLFEVDMADKGLIQKWEKYSRSCFRNHVFQWPINHYGLIDFIVNLDTSCSTVFNGECADSFQNFGFSQYGSIHSGMNNFDEYADKMKTYLYGPSFMQEVLDNTFRNNKIYQIFKLLHTNINFEDSANDYLDVIFSFIYSGSRLPFSKPEIPDIFEEDISSKFYQATVDKHFRKYSDWIKPECIYSIWLALYSDFHCKGLSVPMSINSIEESGAVAALPFFDLRLAGYFMRMPESWGRGLDLNNAKYVEKKMAYNSKTYPLHIVNENIPHSYISENDTSLNPFYEYYCNSAVTGYFKDILASNGSLDCFDVDGIKFDLVKSIRDRFLSEKSVRMEDFPIISKVCVLSSMVYEGMKQ